MGKTLADLGVGMRGRVTGFDKGTQNYRKKLLAMGLIKGTEFTVNRVAPMGDPIEIGVRGYHLSLRKDEAVTLTVEGV
ncbi:ferrous iron transport protein A [Desulforhopalus vacuolatus]|uniref:FeoA family protein n=1 Tax=Desulforhopalus vacuolatus TaxID=40414 RepID=UPI001963A9EB|nr:FeoA family protein [Desulforhopalus vacuolatus]MBM9520614.1 ferrous iron transport protein A [Desulforhopalus vacuolatus]